MTHIIPFLRRNFLVVAHRARSDGSFSLNDLCGEAGRWDGIARCITASLHLSHDMRRDTAVHLLLLGPKDPPKLLSVLGSEVRYLNPDERATVALMKKGLDLRLASGQTAQRASPGIYVLRADLEGVLSSFDGPILLLDEEGADAFSGTVEMDGILGGERWLMLLSDDLELLPEEEGIIGRYMRTKISVSPKVLHAYQAITLCHGIADRSGPGKVRIG